MRKGKRIARIISIILFGIHCFALYPIIQERSIYSLLYCLFNLFPTILIMICLFKKNGYKRFMYQIALILLALGYAFFLLILLAELRSRSLDVFLPVMGMYFLSAAILIALLVQYRKKKRRLSQAACIVGAEIYPILFCVLMLQYRNPSLSSFFNLEILMRITSDVFLWIALFLVSRHDLIPFAPGSGEQEETEAEEDAVEALEAAKDDDGNNPVPEEEFQSRKAAYFK